MPHLHHAVWGKFGSVLFTLILVFAALTYLRGWWSLRSSRLEGISVWRAVSFLIGMLMVWAAVASPIAALDHELLTVHMLQHLLLMTLAPPLIWLAMPVGAVFHGLPQRFVERLQIFLDHSGAAKRFG